LIFNTTLDSQGRRILQTFSLRVNQAKNRRKPGLTVTLKLAKKDLLIPLTAEIHHMFEPILNSDAHVFRRLRRIRDQ
jgi:hypothetical protein